jgi:hypothetical protein
MSRAELVVLLEWLEKNVSKGFIHQSQLSLEALVSYGKTHNREILAFINCQDTNCKMIKNQKTF